ncbi:MAG: aspartyl/asparaginyl beta-hydroxylase domain-containing protein [Brevundimonas sp.]
MTPDSAASPTSQVLDDALAAAAGTDWARARPLLQALVDDGRADATVFAWLATACRHLADLPAAHAAADQALVLDIRDLRALLVKAEMLADQGAMREANFYYGSAVTLAADATGLAADLVDGVNRARDLRRRLASDMKGRLDAELASTGYDATGSSPRFTHALDLLVGKRRIYTPQPGVFYYPELPNAQFYPREAFPWLDAVEAATDAMVEELTAILQDGSAFSPYLNTVPGMVMRTDYPLVDSMDWSSCFLWKDGHETAFAGRCPRTMAALAGAPLCRIHGRSPQIMFSLLKPGAHILPHNGVVNTRLTCHLPLVVPPDCHFRVGNEVRQWEKGRAWVFDDTIEHEARNDSDRARIVLIFDIWRPELSAEERGLVSTLLETLDAYSPGRAAWD